MGRPRGEPAGLMNVQGALELRICPYASYTVPGPLEHQAGAAAGPVRRPSYEGAMADGRRGHPLKPASQRGPDDDPDHGGDGSAVEEAHDDV